MFNVGAASGFSRLADLFFTRRIGLSAGGQPVPIIGGARLSGKVDRHNIAVMNITTQEAFGSPGENFFVGRYSRDILSRSKIGGIIINKEAVNGGTHYNRTFAADTTLALHRNLVVNGFLAKTETLGLSGGDMAGYARAAWLSPSWNITGEYIDLQENFNAELGFIPGRHRQSKFHGEWDPRPGRWGIRMFDPMWNITYTTDQNNRLLTRRMHHMIGTYFEDGSRATIWYNDYFEQLDVPFPIRSDVVIPPGTYRFGEWNFMYNTDPSRRLYAQTGYSPQTFFGGDAHRYAGHPRPAGDEPDRGRGAVQPKRRRAAGRHVRRRSRLTAVRPGAVAGDDAAHAVAIQLDDGTAQHERPVQLDLQPGQRHLHRLRRGCVSRPPVSTASTRRRGCGIGNWRSR